MRKAILSLAVFLLSGIAFAQVTPQFNRGSKGLLFSFDGLDNLNADSFNGGIGGKYYLSSTMAVRGSLQFLAANRDLPANPPAGTTSQDGSISGATLGFTGALEFHRGTGRVNPFFGVGVGFSTTSTENKEANIGASSGQQVIKNNPNGETINGTTFLAGSRIDIFGLLGAEFFVTKELSLAAEYRLGISNNAGKDAEVTQGPTTVTTKVGDTSGVGIATAGFLTLAVYF
jgi:hypothetical protein